MLPVIKRVYRRHPNLVDAIARRHEMYNETLEYLWQEEKRGTTLILCPDEKLPIDRIEHDPDKLRAVYDIGRKHAETRLTEIREFLSE